MFHSLRFVLVELDRNARLTKLRHIEMLGRWRWIRGAPFLVHFGAIEFLSCNGSHPTKAVGGEQRSNVTVLGKKMPGRRDNSLDWPKLVTMDSGTVFTNQHRLGMQLLPWRREMCCIMVKVSDHIAWLQYLKSKLSSRRRGQSLCDQFDQLRGMHPLSDGADRPIY